MLSPRVFTIPPAAPFLATFADALLDGRVIPGLSRASGPLALARAKIYVPTRRAGRALATEWRSASIIPPCCFQKSCRSARWTAKAARPVSITRLIATFPRAIGDIERRMILGGLILTWARNLKRAIVSIDADGRLSQTSDALLVAAHPADAWRLSGELAALIDEMIIENVAWRGLENLGGEFDDYWRITLRFLDIAITAWPQVLAERGVVDPAARQNMLIARAIENVAREQVPVVALGSTGSNVVTARLLAPSPARHRAPWCCQGSISTLIRLPSQRF